MLGGKGSGKTYSLAMKAIALAGINHGVDGGLLAPTYKMFKRDVLPTFERIKRENNLNITFNKQDAYFRMNDSDNRIFVYHSEDDGENIAGSNLGFALINEVTLCKENAYRELSSRLRDKRAKLIQIAMSGTPEEIEWCYTEFLENPRPDSDVYFIATTENKYVADSYIEHLKNTYDSKRLESYLHGRVVLFSGARAAWAFDRTKHVKELSPKFNSVWVSIDFNVDPMSATIWLRCDPSEPYKLYALEDIKLSDSNTYKFSEYLNHRIDELGLRNYLIHLYPDPAGSARKTSASKTDMQILIDAGFQHVKYRKRIASVKDCLNATNSLLDKNEIIIHPRCRELIADLEQCKLKDSGFEIDKSNPQRTHWLDGFKDMIDYEFPIIKLTPTAKVMNYG